MQIYAKMMQLSIGHGKSEENKCRMIYSQSLNQQKTVHLLTNALITK